MKESYFLVFACNIPLLCSEIMPILASKAAKKGSRKDWFPEGKSNSPISA